MCVGISSSITLTEEKIKQYALLSGDFNPIHLDQKEAKRFGFNAPIAHGMLTMGLALEIASSFTQKGLKISEYEMQFIKPVFQNDTIHIVGQEMKRENDVTKLVLVGMVENKEVIKGKLTLMSGNLPPI